MINSYKEFQQYKRLLGVLWILKINTIETAHQYNDWYLTSKRIL